MLRNIWIILALHICLFAADSTHKAREKIEIVDFLGNKSVFDGYAKTHIFLSFCEVIPMLGIWEDARGLSQHVYHTPLLRKTNAKIDSIPKVGGGSGSNLNIEVLKSLNPDIVVVWAGHRKEIDFVKAHGVNIVAFYPDNINEVFDSINLIAKALGKEKIAREKTKASLDMLSIIERKTKQIKSPKRAIYMWDKPNRIAGSNGMIGDMMKRIGVENLGGNLGVDSAEITLERLITLNPEVIFIWGAAKFSPQDLFDNPQFSNIKAIQDKAVYKLPLWDNWGPRIVQTTLLSASLAYPSLYEDVNLDKEISTLNTLLFGVDVR